MSCVNDVNSDSPLNLNYSPKPLLKPKYFYDNAAPKASTNSVLQVQQSQSALNLKQSTKGPKKKQWDLLKDVTVTMIFESNEPILKLAISQATHILGGRTSTITDKIMFEQQYMGSIFSLLSDMLFVSASTHGCVEKFAAQASVPVVCVRSRVHQTLQALATIMTVQEEYKTLKDLRIAYVGRPAQVLNSYLLLCPMLGIHLKFMCCCQKAPVHPVLYKLGTDMCERCGTEVEECMEQEQVLKDCSVVISGPARDPRKPVKDIFNLTVKDIEKNTSKWIYIHTCPKGPEVTEDLFNHKNARTLNTIENMPYVAAALMASSIRNHLF